MGRSHFKGAAKKLIFLNCVQGAMGSRESTYFRKMFCTGLLTKDKYGMK